MRPHPNLLGVRAVGASTSLPSRWTRDERRFLRWLAIDGQRGIFVILCRSGARGDGPPTRASSIRVAGTPDTRVPSPGGLHTVALGEHGEVG
jgi:hypothetical protein